MNIEISESPEPDDFDLKVEDEIQIEENFTHEFGICNRDTIEVKQENFWSQPVILESICEAERSDQSSRSIEEAQQREELLNDKMKCSENSPKSRPMSKEEAMRLVELVAADHIITSKATNASNNKLKEESWVRLTIEFNSSFSNFPRSTQQLRLKWENLKKSARKRAANMRRSRFKTGGGNEYFPPDDVLNKVASLLGSTCEGLPARFGGDALDEIPVVVVPSSSAYMQKKTEEEEEGATETVSVENNLEVSPVITTLTPINQNNFHLHKASGNKQALKTKQNLERERIQAKIKRDLAVADYMASKKKICDAQFEAQDLQLKALKIQLENANLENERLRKLLNTQGELKKIAL